MTFYPTERQKKILSLLLDKYENSLTYIGENSVHQSFSVAPEKVYRKYNDDFEPQEKVSVFEKELDELREQGLVSLVTKNNVVTKIIAVDSAIPGYYQILHRREKKDIISDEKKFYKSCLGKNKIIDDFVNEQLERLSNGRKPKYIIAEAAEMIRLLDVITAHDGDLLERELSITALGDSKIFEKKYRSRIVKILEKYVDTDDSLYDIYDSREKQIAVLEHFGILANPSDAWIRGEGYIRMKNGDGILLSPDYSMGLSSDMISEIMAIHVSSDTVMTVENLTSFNRLRGDCFYVYLGGYHNLSGEHILRLIADWSGKKWYHFGDIDPDGFLIMERLRRKTGIDFSPYHMSIDDLQEYEQYTKPLEPNDIRKAENLTDRGMHQEIMQYMMDNNEKLEQEIISLKIKK